MNETLTPKTLTVAEFMKDGEFAKRKQIPRYQRGYAWTPDEVKDLLDDIHSAMSRQSAQSPAYFIGTMLCIKREEENGSSLYHEIVDGQQRLITLSLIFAVIRRWVQDNDTKEVRKQLGVPVSRFIDSVSSFLFLGGDLLDEDASLQDRPHRLTPGESDLMPYQQIVRDGPGMQGGLRRKRLSEAYNIIQERLSKRMSETAHGAGYLRNFVRYIARKVFVVAIFISDEADAYEVFETLNARSMRLTAVDLIKNKLLSCFGAKKEDVDSAYRQWSEAFVACNERPARMQDYVRCHLQMHEGDQVPPKALYRNLRDMLGDSQSHQRQKAKAFLQEIEKHCGKFGAMFCKDDRFWEEFGDGINDDVGYLNDYRVAYTLMFAMLYANRPRDFVRDAYRIMAAFIKRTRAVRDRFSILEYYEEKFAKLSHQIKEGKGPKTSRAFFKEIKQIDADENGWLVIPDDNFVRELSGRRIKDADAKSMLIELADYHQSQQGQATKVDIGSATLEHVLPQKPDIQDWKEFRDQEQGEDYDSLFVGRLGNLTLLEGGRNTKASNKKFADKKRLAYSPDKCGILLTNELCDYPEWSPKTIRERSQRLAELAAELWSFKDFE